MCHLALIFGGESALGLGPAVCEAAQERRIAHGMTSIVVLELCACSRATRGKGNKLGVDTGLCVLYMFPIVLDIVKKLARPWGLGCAS